MTSRWTPEQATQRVLRVLASALDAVKVDPKLPSLYRDGMRDGLRIATETARKIADEWVPTSDESTCTSCGGRGGRWTGESLDKCGGCAGTGWDKGAPIRRLLRERSQQVPGNNGGVS